MAVYADRSVVERLLRYSADNDEEPSYSRRGKSKVRSDNDADDGSQASLRETREQAGTRKGARDPVWPVRRSGGSRKKRSRSSSRESVPWNRSAIRGRRSSLHGGSELSVSPGDSDWSDNRRPVRSSPQGTIGLNRLGRWLPVEC